MHLIKYPHFVPAPRYDLAIERMVEKIKKQDGVVSIFQIGNVTEPGISDIDILVLFEDGVSCDLNPLKGLSRTDRYLFAHSLYGVSISHLSDACNYTFFDNYIRLWGEELSLVQNGLSNDEIDILKTQTALEYLIKMFINCTVQKTYGIVKLRGLLLLANALSYDLEFLNVSSGKLFDLIQEIILWRNNWFNKKPDNHTIKKWFNKFYEELTSFLELKLREKIFYLPDWANLQIAENMSLVISQRLGYIHKGMTLPTVLGDLGKKYFNIQHRLNRFQFQIPIKTSGIPDGLLSRFVHILDMKMENARNLPHFIIPTSALNISLKIAA